MKHAISTPRLALTFAGCFLGAGYVSGRELWQFFGQYGLWGWLGLLVGMSVLAIFGALILHLARRTGQEDLSTLVIPWEIPLLRRCVSVFSLLILFGVVTIMTAGAGALFHQSWGLPAGAMGLLFCLVMAVLALAGLEGMVSVFSCIVPVLTLAALGMSAAALRFLPSTPPPHSSSGHWLFSALTFAAYNIFSTIAILAPMGRQIHPRTVRKGIPLGGGLLFLIAGTLMLALSHCGDATAQELPMLLVASRLSPLLGLLYAVLLLSAMLGTALSCFLTAVNTLRSSFPFLRKHATSTLFLLAFLSWIASLMGFGQLIGVVYPLFGCMSAFFLACMTAGLWKSHVPSRQRPAQTETSRGERYDG